MIDNDVPLIAYIYVGITSLVLAYVTYNDETNRASGATKSDSSTPILPAFLTGASSGQSNSSSGSILPAASPPASSGTPPSNSTSSILPSFMQTGQNSQGAVRGGKRKHTKGIHKKPKSNKSKKNK